MTSSGLIQRIRSGLPAPRPPRSLEELHGPPTIVIGMHRSGTSLVTRLLRACGGHFGTELDGNSEPIQIIRVNDALLRCYGASWRRLPRDLPKRRHTRHARAVRMLLRRRHWIWDGLFKSFGGEARESVPPPARLRPLWSPLAGEGEWPQTRGPSALWGWKDPRNTLTLAAWLELFPRARVLHVVRNGVDVALSLQRRALQNGTGLPECHDLESCFELWERYVEEGLAWRRLPADRYHELRYEDLLADPRGQLQALLEFAGGEQPCAERPEVLALCRRRPPRPPEAHAHLLEHAARSVWFRELGYTQRRRASL